MAEPAPDGVRGPAVASDDRIRLDDAVGRMALLAVVVGASAVFMDTSIVNVALPTIADRLGASVAQQQWVVNAYMVTLAALLLVGGRLGDRHGRRRMYLAGLWGFVATTLLAAVAPNVGMLVAARALQGVAGALLTPGSLAIIQASFARRDRARAIGLWTSLSGATTAGGPLLGGWLTDRFGWRSVFVVLAAVAALAAVLTVRNVPESRQAGVAGRIDIPGAVLAGIGLAALSWGLTSAGDRGGLSVPIVVALAASVVASVAFVVVQRRVTNPLLPPALWHNRPLVVVNGLTLVVYGALGATSFLVSLYLQNALEYSALAAGAATLPMIVALVVGSPVMGEVSRRYGPRRPLTLGPVVMAVGAGLLSLVVPGDAYVVAVLPGVLALGMGLAVVVTPVTASALAVVDDDSAGLASGVNNAVARTAQLLAVAVLPVVVGLSGDDLQVPDVFAPAFATAMRIVAGMALLAALVAWTLLDDDEVDLGRDDADDRGPDGGGRPDASARGRHGDVTSAGTTRPTPQPDRRPVTPRGRAGDLLGSRPHVLAVVAHPDDESFGLGGIIAALVDSGAVVDVVCLTHGEASTLGRADHVDLGDVRAEELQAAGHVLGVGCTRLLSWPDGGLAEHPLAEVAAPVVQVVADRDVDALLAFDDTGVTGHPDHRHATRAARSVGQDAGLAVYGWAVTDEVAAQLNEEFATTFNGHPTTRMDLAVPVDRDRQRRAIACHASQATDNPVLWRRLELSGDTDHLRRLG